MGMTHQHTKRYYIIPVKAIRSSGEEMPYVSCKTPPSLVTRPDALVAALVGVVIRDIISPKVPRA